MGFKCSVCGKEAEYEFDLTEGICDECLYKKISFSRFILYISERLEDFFEFWLPWLKIEDCEDYDNDIKVFILKQLFDRFILDYNFSAGDDRKYMNSMMKDYVHETLEEWAVFLLEDGAYDYE